MCKAIIELLQTELEKTGETWITLSRLSGLFWKKYKRDLTIKDFEKNNNFRMYHVNYDTYIALAISYFPTRKYQSEQNQEYKSKQYLNVNPESTTTQKNDQTVKEIKSLEDLETALSMIMQESDIKSVKFSSINISVLSSRFYKIYRQPIRSVIKTIAPDFTLKELIEIISLANF
jgi:hypothetical protein